MAAGVIDRLWSMDDLYNAVTEHAAKGRPKAKCERWIQRLIDCCKGIDRMRWRSKGILLIALPVAALWGCSDKSSPTPSYFESPESVRYTHLRSIYNAVAHWTRKDIDKQTFSTVVATLGNTSGATLGKPDQKSEPDHTGTYTAKWGNFSYYGASGKTDDSVLIAKFDNHDRVLSWRLNFISFDEGSLQVWDHRRIEYAFDHPGK
jgi:hypothetical protein